MLLEGYFLSPYCNGMLDHFADFLALLLQTQSLALFDCFFQKRNFSILKLAEIILSLELL
jgi:hypothetical protein